MKRVITQKQIEKIEINLRKVEELEFKAEDAAAHFIKAMKETNRLLQKQNQVSIGYTNVYNILNKRTKIFSGRFIDVTYLYNKNILQDMISEMVGAEKLEKMFLKANYLLDQLNKIDYYKNEMRESIEDYNDCAEVEELIDAIESISLKNVNSSVSNVRNKIDFLKRKIKKVKKTA